MLTRDEIENLIYNTVDIVPPGEDSVFLGVFFLADNPPTLNAVLTKVTAYYDTLLATIPFTPSQRLEVQMLRCFTYDEYKVLFTSVQEKQFAQHSIFKTLLITTQAERLLFITNQNRDDSYASFLAFLQKWSKVHNPYIYSLLHDIHN